jgi:hypothetical protein
MATGTFRMMDPFRKPIAFTFGPSGQGDLFLRVADKKYARTLWDGTVQQVFDAIAEPWAQFAAFAAIDGKVVVQGGGSLRTTYVIDSSNFSIFAGPADFGPPPAYDQFAKGLDGSNPAFIGLGNFPSGAFGTLTPSSYDTALQLLVSFPESDSIITDDVPSFQYNGVNGMIHADFGDGNGNPGFITLNPETGAIVFTPYSSTLSGVKSFGANPCFNQTKVIRPIDGADAVIEVCDLSGNLLTTLTVNPIGDINDVKWLAIACDDDNLFAVVSRIDGGDLVAKLYNLSTFAVTDITATLMSQLNTVDLAASMWLSRACPLNLSY